MMPLLVRALLLVLAAPTVTHGFLFTTTNHDLTRTLWDTWLYRSPAGWLLNFLTADRSTHMWCAPCVMTSATCALPRACCHGRPAAPMCAPAWHWSQERGVDLALDGRRALC